MDEMVFFPNQYWINKIIDIPDPVGAWDLIEKISETSDLVHEQDMEQLRARSLGQAVFRCHNIADAEQPEALMTVCLQLPLKESLGLPSSMRRSEALDDPTPDFKQAIQAYQRLKLHGCNFTPQYFGSFQGRQDDDGPVPGGFINYLVYSSVPGVPLGSGTLGCDFGRTAGGPQAVLALSEEDQQRCRKSTIPDGPFWTFRAEKRATIRQQFQAAFT